MRQPTAVPAATLAVVLALVVSTSSGSSNGSAGASQTSTTTSGSAAARGGGQPSAAAWCAMVIDINTRGGTMANKQYLQSGLTDPAKAKAVSQEAVNRRKEFLAITPGDQGRHDPRARLLRRGPQGSRCRYG